MHGQELPGVYVLEWNSTLREYISGTHQRTTAAKTCCVLITCYSNTLKRQTELTIRPP